MHTKLNGARDVDIIISTYIFVKIIIDAGEKSTQLQIAVYKASSQ